MASAAVIGQATSDAIAAIPPDLKSALALRQPMIGALSVGLARGIEKATGLPVGSTLSPIVAATLAGALELVSGVALPHVSAAIESATGAIAGSLGSGLASAIPVLGNYVAVAFDIIGAAIAGSEITPGEKAGIEQKWHKWCDSKAGHLRDVRGTGFNNRVDFSDLFRRLKFCNGKKPADFGGVVALLCGDEAPKQFGGMSKAQWKRHVDVWGPIGELIPRPTRRAMWKMVAAILANVRDPLATVHDPIVGDNGRTIGPLLLGTLLEELRAGHWSLGQARSLQDYFLTIPKQFCVKGEYPKAGIVCRTKGSCRKLGLDVGFEFYRWVLGWDTCLKECAACLGSADACAPLGSKAAELVKAAATVGSFARKPKKCKGSRCRTPTSSSEGGGSPGAPSPRVGVVRAVGPVLVLGAAAAAVTLWLK